MTTNRKLVELYTDGACNRNPGPGGFAALLLCEGKERIVKGGFRRTTNNRMEIMAVLEGLRVLKRPCSVRVYSDSQYVVNTISRGWAKRWQERGWVLLDGGRALNADLWEQVLKLCSIHDVKCHWIRGHAGHKSNERCDQIARGFAARADLPVDKGYMHELEIATDWLDETPAPRKRESRQR
jgi:ribonuclease HI